MTTGAAGTDNGAPLDEGEHCSVVVVDHRRLVREAVAAHLAAQHNILVLADTAKLADGRAYGGQVVVVERAQCDGSAATDVVLDDDSDFDSLPERIRAAARPRQASPEANRRATARALTRRQRSVLRSVGRGQSALQIAADLGISARTVERHKQLILERLGVQNHAQAIALAHRNGLLD